MIDSKTIYSRERGNSAIAKAYHDAGLNILPLKCDGSKTPRIRWAQYTRQTLPWYSAQHWFKSLGDPSGIAIVCGSTSGGLEVVDHDVFGLFEDWSKAVKATFPNLLKSLPIVATPSKGWHIYYRCEAVETSLDLARDESGSILVETRGQGAIVVAPGSPASVHRAGKQYLLINGDLLSIPTITPAERQAMLDTARQFNQYVKPTTTQKPFRQYLGDATTRNGGTSIDSQQRPGDWFNCNADWCDILEPHGWTIAEVRGQTIYWRRPGKSSRENHSATTGYGESDSLYVFSSSVSGFEAGKAYQKFAAYAILNCDGNFAEAAKQIRKQQSLITENT